MKPCTIFLLILIAASTGASAPYSQTPGMYEDLCPTIAIACPDVSTGPVLKFAVRVTAAPSAKITFKWTVSLAKIASGQGTPSIEVNMAGFEGQSVTATVEVGGIPKACPNKASCTTAISAKSP